MSLSTLKFTLALSLLLNAGVLGAIGYEAARQGGLPPVFGTSGEAYAADYLKLSPEQRERWRVLEADFMTRFEADTREIAAHRERLIREIFSDSPRLERIESERELISRLQTEQQRRVIAQLMRERDILDRTQRLALAEFLLQQAAELTPVERMHRN
jgi:hypothetical protein